jgi:hypothetical protein
MFKHNKYTKTYFAIIDRAKQRSISGYVEVHHIVPKCLGGTDEAENTVRLTAREHFICHLLLTKMHDDHLLKFAFASMNRINDNQTGKRIPIKTSVIYEYLKKCNSVAASIRSTGIKNNIGKKKYYNPETGKEILRFDHPGDPWVLGSMKLRANHKGVHSGKVYYNHPETGKVINLPNHIDPPPGFVKGNPKAAISLDTFGGTKYYYNPETLEETRSKHPIEGWIPGRSRFWITNGSDNITISMKDNIPLGWSKGRSRDKNKGFKKKDI